MIKKLTLLIALCTAISYSQVQREIAITIDDLPAATSVNNNQTYNYIQNNLLKKMIAVNEPVTGFVNEGKIFVNGKIDSQRISLLENWLDAGFELGNHTYAHKSANKVSVQEYIEDIKLGEPILKDILGKRNKKLEFFRHPYLQTGRSIEVMDSINNYLKENNYKIGAVTIDNSDWLIAGAYEKAYLNSDSAMMKKIADDYIPYMISYIKFFEQQSIGFLKRNMKHILLMHANRLNADNYDKLISAVKAEGYKIITLDEAIQDKAYSEMKDTFIGAGGISWIHRWTVSAKVNKEFYAGEPEVPEYIVKYAEKE